MTVQMRRRPSKVLLRLGAGAIVLTGLWIALPFYRIERAASHYHNTGQTNCPNIAFMLDETEYPAGVGSVGILWINRKSATANFGDEYTLFRQEGERWVNAYPDDNFFYAILYEIRPFAFLEQEREINPALPPGNYRLEIPFWFEDRSEYTATADFKIVE